MRIEITNIDSLKDDINKLLGNRPFSKEERQWFAKAFIREVLKARHYRSSGEVPRVEGDVTVEPVLYEHSNELEQKARYILDWLAELETRNPLLHSKLSRITFKQAHKHSEKWHAELAKAAEKSERYIEPDEENAPKVLDLDDGWEVFWLKTDLARDIEGDVMGHCVGGGGYDQLEPGRAIFSVRKNNIARLTLDLSGRGIVQAVTKGNGEVPERYQWLVNTVALKLTAALILSLDPVHVGTLSDGRKQGPSGDIAYLKNGLLHREDGPALIRSDGSKSWWANGLDEYQARGTRRPDFGTERIRENKPPRIHTLCIRRRCRGSYSRSQGSRAEDVAGRAFSRSDAAVLKAAAKNFPGVATAFLGVSSDRLLSGGLLLPSAATKNPSRSQRYQKKRHAI